jgi:5-methylcytosine-specific restriction endonuclease McrA
MCEIDPVTRDVIRIFKHGGGAIFLPPERIAEYAKAYAVGRIRHQVFEASKGECRNCGRPINWKFHLHEVIPKGKGGEVSLDNSIALCADCHLNQEHKARTPQFQRSKNVVE